MPDLDGAGGRVHFEPVAGVDGLVGGWDEAVHERKLGEDGALDHHRVGDPEDEAERRFGPGGHFLKHPGGGDAAFGGGEDQYALEEALAVEIVGLAGEEAVFAIEIVAGAEAVLGDQGRAGDGRTDTGRTGENGIGRAVWGLAHQGIWPVMAALTHTLVGRKTGL